MCFFLTPRFLILHDNQCVTSLEEKSTLIHIAQVDKCNVSTALSCMTKKHDYMVHVYY